MPFSSDVPRFAGKNIDAFCGVFKPNGASAIDNTVNVTGYGVGARCGFTVARVGTGLYTVTLDQPYPAFTSVQLTGYNLGARWVDVVTPPGPLTNGVSFQIQAKDNAGAAVDIAAGANVLVGFEIRLKMKGGLAS